MNRQEEIQIIKNNWPNGRHMLSEALEFLIPELKESEDEKMKREILELVSISGNGNQYEEIKDWLEKQCTKEPKKTSIWKHWNNGIAGNGASKTIYLIKNGNDYSLSSCLGYECDYILLSDLDKLMLEEKHDGQKHLELKAGHWYFCHQAYCERADILTVKEGETFKCEKDGVVKGLIIKEPEKYFREISAPSDKVEPKFKVGDWVIDKQDIVHQIANVIENVTNHTYGYDIVGGEYFNDNTEGVKLWTIQDAKDGDVLVGSDDSIFIFKEIVDSGCKHYIALEEDGKTINVNDNLEHFWEATRGVKPSTKEQRDLLFQKMKEAGYEWDAEKKELKKIEQKPADKKYTFNAIPYLLRMIQPTDRAKAYCQKLIDILIQEGYNADANIVGKCLKQMNGEKVAMATMDEQKPAAWSEEDERRMQQIISDLEQCTVPGFPIYIGGIELEINWLKSLKERMKGE